jgi:hypothetical protein
VNTSAIALIAKGHAIIIAAMDAATIHVMKTIDVLEAII